jgi:hypothetical protein
VREGMFLLFEDILTDRSRVTALCVYILSVLFDSAFSAKMKRRCDGILR